MFNYCPEPPLDPPEDVVFAMCDHCGGEIYEGEEYYDIDGQYIHEDCLRDFAEDYFSECKCEAIVERRHRRVV